MAIGAATVLAQSFPDNGIVRYQVTWGADPSGNVNGHQSAFAGISVGPLLHVQYTNFVQAPSDLYDVTLIDGNGIDHLQGLGTDLRNTAGMHTIVLPLLWSRDAAAGLDLVVTNAGVNTNGLMWLYYRLWA